MAKYNYDDSLLDLAIKVMQESEKGLTLSKVFEEIKTIKNMNAEEAKQEAATFYVDFMLSGYFVVIGADKNTQEKVWDLKERQETDLLDKPGEEDIMFDEETQKEIEENELNEKNAKKSVKTSENEDEIENPDAIINQESEKTTNDEDNDSSDEDDNDDNEDKDDKNSDDDIESALKAQ